MRSTQILALAGLAAAQSTTIVISSGISTTIVLPEWDVGSGGSGSDGGASVTLAVPTPATTVDVSINLPDATTTVVVDETDVVGTVTETNVPTSFLTSTVSVPTVVPSGTGAIPPVVTVSGASSLSVELLASLVAFAAAGFALL